MDTHSRRLVVECLAMERASKKNRTVVGGDEESPFLKMGVICALKPHNRHKGGIME